MSKVSDIKKARRKKRDKTGWTMAEIKENARKELAEFKKTPKEEPDALASGDMNKIFRGEDADD